MDNAEPKNKMPRRYRVLLFQTLQLLRKEIAPQFGDWKDADDWLFSNLDITKRELEQIYEGRNASVYGASCVDDSNW